MMKRSVLPLLFALPACAAVAADWPCQGPQPGHPTASERRAFVAKVSELAVAAEGKHGVPAAAIAAMAIVESGYGWTRVGRDAHNLLGWKYIAAQAGGRPAYVLACQPYGDGSRQYTVFRSEAESMD
jgi:flagellum-specific peptidoglycan hydrolase FlgJ